MDRVIGTLKSFPLSVVSGLGPALSAFELRRTTDD